MFLTNVLKHFKPQLVSKNGSPFVSPKSAPSHSLNSHFQSQLINYFPLQKILSTYHMSIHIVCYLYCALLTFTQQNYSVYIINRWVSACISSLNRFLTFLSEKITLPCLDLFFLYTTNRHFKTNVITLKMRTYLGAHHFGKRWKFFL